MKICMISDTHCNRVTIPKCDLLLHTGDATNSGSLKQTTDFFDWMKEVKEQEIAKAIVACAGNHDTLAVKNPKLVQELAEKAGVNYIHNQQIEIFGLKIWAASWVHLRGPSWAYNCAPSRDLWTGMRGCDIVMTHQPPYGILDQDETGEHAGCRELLEEVQSNPNIKIHCYGHLHEGYGKTTRNKTIFCNSAIKVNGPRGDKNFLKLLEPLEVDL